jgi:diguanylate cyclase (GGDEF)-like protein
VAVKRGRQDLVRVAHPRASKQAPHRVSVHVAAIALATAGAVVLAGGRQAFWLCIPAGLASGVLPRTRLGIAMSTATVVLAAAAPAIAWGHLRPLPAPGFALVVPIMSVLVLAAVRERLEHEREALREFALRDPLTGVANRRSLQTRAEYEIVRHSRNRRGFAVVMLDLDGFKLLNDRFGHAAGDDLLCDVAAALARATRAQDTVARIGGDEFCVLAPETGGAGTLPLATRLDHAVRRATAGVEALHASAGIAVFPDDGSSVAALLHAADLRLLVAKRERHRGRSERRAA